ncbi:MAG: YcgL domain-containing protein [Pseudomonadota bacterium]
MKTFVYRGSRKADTYLYVLEQGQFDHLPENLLALLGRLEFAMEVDLGAVKQLANADLGEVKNNLQENGYYLQLPRESHIAV